MNERSAYAAVVSLSSVCYFDLASLFNLSLPWSKQLIWRLHFVRLLSM